ncbi:DUF6544 family protein [Nodosilinea sp. PGN35]|uniref:DUF6544 family protein n=1 Tax=Nodosilinea sp. PGN35 TaxID=3020489 RepID=UPI0023B25504|nr:DUF6544 family protein [Nodosilinea sp. TSF1-S3]MDF0369569.1 hypothetical protein [Nodosilinea sp. TSF1-S3]
MPQPLATKPVSLEALWKPPSTVPTAATFDPATLSALPPLARRYLNWAIAPATPLASAVRLQMHGTIKLGDRWHRFTGEEVIRWQRGMIWRATTWMQGLPIFGSDRLVDGEGDMGWKLLGLLPVMQASGEDVARSGAGRIQGEAVWLPSVFCDPAIHWTALSDTQLQAEFTAFGEPAHLTLTLDERGAIQQVALRRWGNPDGTGYRYDTFGVMAEASRTFDGYTIPAQIRAGWFFGSNSPPGTLRERFESEGEFFRCTIDRACYR